MVFAKTLAPPGVPLLPESTMATSPQHTSIGLETNKTSAVS